MDPYVPQHWNDNMKVDDHPPPQANVTSLLCGICGDDATGKHYGSISCDGCKGFFRRSVRRHSQYICRQSKTCTITKDKRNQCRYCRLRKCFRCGMKKEAVQHERDKISRHRPSETFLECLTIESLQKSEAAFWDLCKFRFGSNPTDEKREANLSALCAAVKVYACCLMEWAARIPPYNELSGDDKALLCRSKVVQIFVLEVAYRSIHSNDIVLLFNNCIISSSSPYDELNDPNVFDMRKIGLQIQEELTNPFTDFQIDEKEYAGLKAALFFDPNVRGLTEDLFKIRNWRRQIASNLMEYISDRESDSDRNSRGAEIWLLLLPLQRISYQIIDLLQYAGLCGEVSISSFVNDALCGGAPPTSSTPNRSSSSCVNYNGY